METGRGHSTSFLFRGKAPIKKMIEVEKSRLQRFALRWFGRSVIRDYSFEELCFLPLARRVRCVFG